MSKEQKEARQAAAEELEGCTLEQVFDRLEEVISEMEGEVSLEKSFQLYRQGVELLEACNAKIDRVEKQILVLDEEGNVHEF